MGIVCVCVFCVAATRGCTCTLTTFRSLVNTQVIGQRSRSRGFFVLFGVDDTAATRDGVKPLARLDDLVLAEFLCFTVTTITHEPLHLA